ncbi:amino acid adenylation domain-containing protein [Streptomyces sp. Edi2]|uniref:non-ribosomal peptide synthetase n=1 Tax=Streptomyces sp. Edi2 TaxID=3162528 RepID=UPI0033057191
MSKIPEQETPGQRLGLSFEQDQLWFLAQLNRGETAYNLLNSYRIRGELDTVALNKALSYLVARHPQLRATFHANDGVPYQVISPIAEVRLAEIDLSDFPADECQRRLDEWLQEAGDTPFDLETGPLHRFSLIRLADNEHVLALSFHHIVTDGWSAGVLSHELSVAYQQLIGGRDPSLPEPRATYAEHVLRQRSLSASWEQQLQFWENALAGLPALELPSDRIRPAVASQRGDVVRVELPTSLVRSIYALASQENATLFMVVTAALNVVLSRYTGQEDISVGIPVLGRMEQELEEVVGLFINMAVLRSDLSGDPTFSELIDRVSGSNMDVYDNQDVPFDQVVARVQPVRASGRNPLFQVGVQVLSDDTSGSGLVLDGLEVEPVAAAVTRARYDLAVAFTESGEGLTLTIEYALDLFDRWRIEAMAAHLQSVLASAAASPSLPLSKLSILTGSEREQILAAGYGGKFPYSSEPVHATIARVAAEGPDRVAAICRGVELTYGELIRRADVLAHYLRAQGVLHEQVVTIAMDRDLDTLVALVGVLRAGAAFTVIDPSHPVSRLDHILHDTQTPLVITRSTMVGDLPEPDGWNTLLLDTQWEDLESSAVDSSIEEWATRDSLAYVLYTSGSTGRPKGVLIEHRALRCFIEAYWRTFGFTPDDRLLQLPALTFDMSIGEIFTALIGGASLVLVAPVDASSPEALATLMRDQRVTYAGLSPAMLSLVVAGPYPDLKYVMGGADALPAELVNKWNLPGRQFVNLYGPTEAAIACLEYNCEKTIWQSSPPIGAPEFDRRVYIVGSDGNLVPRGVPGELLIGGDEGLARGYLNQPDLTAEKFIDDPFHPGGKVYRSGDQVRWTKDLQVDFMGRLDNQVKLRGLRIELGEIESILLTHPGVKMATVLLRPDSRGEKRLVAYVTTHDSDALHTADLRSHLAKQLPEYMVPTSWVMLDEFPLTPARKIDRAALPLPEEMSVEGFDRQSGAPVTMSEAGVADVYSAVLSRPNVGVEDSFFDMGGNSLQAMRAVSRLNKRFGVKIGVRMLYGTATVGAVAAAIDDLVASKPEVGGNCG